MAQTASNPEPTGRLITSHAIVLNSATHKVYAVDQPRGTVSIIDTRTRSSSSVKVGESPIAIALNPTTNRIYVLNNGSGTVSVLDGRTDAVLATVEVGSNPYVIAANVANNKIFVSNTYSNLLTIIDGATNATSKFKAGSADAMAVDSKLNHVYLLGYEDPKLRLLDSTYDSMTRIPAGAAHLWGMAVNEVTGTLYVTRIGTADVIALDERTNAITPIATGTFPCAVAVDPKTNTVYVVNYGDSSLSIIDGAKNKVVATIAVGRQPEGLAVDVENHRVYVANAHADSITVIDGTTHVVMETVAAGSSPYGVAVDSKDSAVYAANFGEQSVTRVAVRK